MCGRKTIKGSTGKVEGLTSTVAITFTFHLGFVHPLQDVAFHQCLLSAAFLFHLSPRLCPSTAECSPPSMSSIVFCLLLTYLCPSLPVEHRPSTIPRHRTLFWAALVIPDQLVPCCFSSASVSRLQLLRGRPLFLFP